MIVERSLVDIRSDSSTMCANSDQQLTRSEESNGDIELEKLDFSDSESSSERSSGTSINVHPYKNEHISQYHSIQQLCTPTSSCSKTEEGIDRDHYQNSFNCPGVKVKTEGCSNYCSHTRELERDVLSDEDFLIDEFSNKRQRLAEENSQSFHHLTDVQYRPKRKQTQPKHCDGGATLRSLSPNLSKKSMLESLSGAHRDLQELQRRLNIFKKRYESILFEDAKTGEEASFETDDDESKRLNNKLDEAKPGRMEAFVKLLKSEVSQNMEIFVDHVVRQFVQRNQQQFNLALQQPRVNSSDEQSDERTQDVFENFQKFSTFEPIHLQQEKPLNYSLQVPNKKEDFSGQESYKTYLRQLANSNYKALYPLSNIQSMIPMFLPPFNPGYMFHNSNVYHPLFYHSGQKPQENFRRESSASTSLMSEPEQSEAIPLVVNPQSKKKRTKVTDSRFSPRIRFHQSDSSEPNSQLLHPENSQNLPEKRMLSYETKSFSKSLSAHQDLPSSKEQCSDEGDFYKSTFQAFIAPSQNMHESDVFASVYKQNASSLSICEDLQNHLGDKFAYEAERRGSSCHIGGRPRSVSVEELKREDSLKLYKDSRRSRGFASTTSETGFEEQLMISLSESVGIFNAS